MQEKAPMFRPRTMISIRTLVVWRYCLIAVLLMLVASCTVLAADTDDFFEQTLPQEGKILATVPADYDDADGAELFVFAVDNLGTRHLRVYSPDAAGLYDTIPKADLDLPEGVFGYQVADINADRRDEFLLLGLDAVYQLQFEKDRYASAPKTIAAFEPLFAIPNPDFITLHRFAFDLNADGVIELVLPTWNGVRLLQKKESGYTQFRQLSLAYRADGVKDINLLKGTCSGELGFHLPMITAHDLNTDKSSDLLMETSSGLAVFYQTGNLQFAERPNRVLDIKSSYLEDIYFRTASLADLNNDRLLDYCRVFTQSSGTEYKTVIEIFLGNMQEGYSTRPSKRIVLDEYGVGLSLLDLDGDGVSSVIVATIPVTPTSLVKALLVKGMPLDLRVYESDGGVFGDQPVMTKRITCGLNFFKNVCPVRYVGALTGDLDSDSKCDLVVITDDNELQVFPGSKKVIFADKPSIVRKTSGVVALETADLNHDAKADLILLGRDEDGRDIITLLMTK
jgi:hypothetical protein